MVHESDESYRAQQKREIVERIENHVGSIAEICDGVGIGRRTFYAWKQEDAQFAKDVERAQLYNRQDLEDEAVRRAMRGSDKLMIELLRAYFPEKFTERRDLRVSGTWEEMLAGLPRFNRPKAEPDRSLD